MPQFIMVGGAPPEATFLGSLVGSTNATSYTATPTLDTATSERIIVAGFMCGTLTANLTAPTCSAFFGQTPILAVQAPAGATALFWWQIWYAVVPNNTSNTVTFNRAANMASGIAQIWSIKNVFTSTPFDAQRGTGGSPTATTNVNTSSGGIAISFGPLPGATAGTFTGTTQGQQTTAGAGTGAGSAMSSAYLVPAAGGSLAVTFAQTPPGATLAANVATWAA